MGRYYVGLALRRCRQNVGMVALLVLTMALGIASCMTALTIFQALSGEPLPGISEHLYVATMDAREVADKDTGSYDAPHSYLKLTDARALVDAHRARQQVALAQTYTRIGTADGQHAQQVRGLLAYGPVLQMFGVPLRFGRGWSAAEQAANDPVIVIDSDLATALFGRADAVGRSVAFGNRSFRVIGVTAPWKPHTEFLDLPRNEGAVLGQDEQVFVPAQAALAAGEGPLTSGECGKGSPVVSFQSSRLDNCRWLETWVSLESPASVKKWGRFLADYAGTQHASGRFVHKPQAKLYGVTPWMTANHVVPDDVSLNLALAGSFLLLCLVNVAGLLAARFLRRQADVAIRRALGASRRDVFAQHVVETGILGLLGGVVALPLTALGLWIVRMQPVAYGDAARFSPAVFAMLLLLSLGVGLIVGILPAWRVCRQPPALQIKVA